MTKVTKEVSQSPATCHVDREVVAFRSNFEERGSLDELVRSGAQRMLQTAIESEVQDFLEQHVDRRDEKGNRVVIRNGYLPGREEILSIVVFWLA